MMRHRQAMNQKTTVFKKNHAERRKQRKQKDQKKERMEGTTFESGISLINGHAALVQSLFRGKRRSSTRNGTVEETRCLSAPNFVSLVGDESIVSSSMI